MAITNHVIVRYSAVLVGKTNFKDYLVLGDDVVIARSEVAVIYQKVIVRIGVGISLHKSILPSEKIGLEFASKLINSDGNLSPLPVVLLTKGGIVCKIQFLTEVVTRLVDGNVTEGPDLSILFDAIFGKRLADNLGGLWGLYFIFSIYRKAKSQDLLEGHLPEFFQKLNKVSGISLVEDLLTLHSTVKLSAVKSIFDSLEAEKLKTFHKISKILLKGIIREYILKLIPLISALGRNQALNSTEIAQLSVVINQYLKGPFSVYLINVLEVINGREPFVGPLPRGRSMKGHEMWTNMDTVLRRAELELIDHIIRYG